jgi:hypothetical protein
MEDKRDVDPIETAEPAQARAAYVPPELIFLGDVRELTRGAAGSRSDGGFAQSSSLRFKKDVSYVDDEARHAIARDLLSLRLATWEYKGAESPGRRHLGFIIEDSPAVDAVNPSKDTIDLYAYASMAIAAVQVQAKEIEDLRRELIELRGALDEARGKR